MTNIKALLAVAGSLLAACSSLTAATFYTENFTPGNAAWSQNTNTTGATWISSGGLGGVSDGYITTTYTVTTAITGNPVVARASLNNNASNGYFAGNYTTTGITTISLSLKSDATFALPIGLRLGGTTGGYGMTINGGLLAPGSGWTTYTFDLSATNPNILSFEGTPGATNADKFAAVMASVANLQIFLNLPDPSYTPPGSSTPVTFSVDGVQAVPEPSTYVLMGLGLGALFFFRRKFRKA